MDSDVQEEMRQAPSPDRSKARPLLCAIGCTILLALGNGLLQVLSIMIPNVVEGLGVSLATVTAGSMIGMFSGFLFNALATKLIDVLTPRWSLLLGTVFAAVTLALVSFGGSVVFWFLSCVCSGVVLGFGANASVAGLLGSWYGERSPRVFGVVAGIATFVIAGLVIITGQMLDLMDYRRCTGLLAVAVLVVGVAVNLLFLKNAPRSADGTHGDGDSPEASGPTMKQAARTASFGFFLAAMFVAAFPTNGFSGFASTYFSSYGIAASEYTAYVAAFMVFGAVIVATSGTMIEKFGAKRIIPVIFTCFALGVVLLMLWSAEHLPWLAVLSMLFASFITIAMNLPAMVVPEIFGMRAYASITAAGMAAFFIGAGIMMLSLALFAEAFGMNAAYIALAVLGLVAMALLLLAVSRKPRRDPEGQ